jgi:dienelactone hydrolase
MSLRSALILSALVLPGVARAEVKSKTIQYKDGDLELEGFLAWDDAVQGKRPGVLVVHEWWGLNDYARQRAEMLAKMGYVAFALDMYGKGKLTTHPQEAGAWATEIRKNTAAWQARAMKGLEVLRAQELVDTSRVAAMGYCFGGSTVIQLAYAGAPLRGVASFHGALPPAPEGVKKVEAKVLICHGAADPFIPPKQVDDFRATMDRLGADWHMVIYGGAKHSFTNPGANKAGVDGLEYNEKADRRSWSELRSYLEELFGK